LQYAAKFERCAILGDQSWQEWMIKLAKPFFRVKYFDRSQREEAWRWLMQPVEHADGNGIVDTVSHFVRRYPVASFAIAGAAMFLLARQMSSSRSRSQLTCQR